MSQVNLTVKVFKSELTDLIKQISSIENKKINISVNGSFTQSTNEAAKAVGDLNEQLKAAGQLQVTTSQAQGQAAKSSKAYAEVVAELAKSEGEYLIKLQEQDRKDILAKRAKKMKEAAEAQKAAAKAQDEAFNELVKGAQAFERALKDLEKQEEKEAREREAAMKAAAQHVAANKEIADSTNKISKATDNMLVSMLKAKAITFIVSTITSQFKQALETMKEVDSELVTIRKVTGASTERIDEIRQAAYSTASKYGESAADYLGAVASFSRAGYGDLAESLAELATKTQLVGDVDQETAVQFLLSTDAAYKYKGSVEDLSKVLDGANEIDNKYATSIQKIAEGMGLVAPVAAQVNVSEQELAAAIGTITAVTQRSGTEAARALRSLFLNIIGDTTTEIEEGVTATEESVTSLRNLLKRYAPEAVAAAEATGKIIDPMEAIAALSKAMQDGLLTEQQLMESLSSLGGKLRITQLVSLVQNYNGMYSDMLHDYSHAVGSADREVENALDSWERKANILKNTWTEFVSKTINTNAIKGFLDVLTGILQTVGSLGNALAIVGAVIVAIKLPKIIDTLTKIRNTLQDVFSQIASGQIGLSTIQITILAVTAAVTAITAAYRKYYQQLADSSEHLQKQSEASLGEYQNMESLRKEVTEAEAAYRNGTSSKEEYEAVTQRVAKALGLEAQSADNLRVELERLSGMERQQALQSANLAMQGIAAEIAGKNGSTSSNIDAALRRAGFFEATTTEDKITAARKAQEGLIATQTELSKRIVEGTATWGERNLEYKRNQEALDWLTEQLDEYARQEEIVNILNGETAESTEGEAESFDTLTGKIEEAADAFEEFTKATSTELDDQFQKYVSAYKQFLEDWEAGLKGSNAVKAAAELFFTDEQINDLRAKGMDVGEILANDFYKGIFSAEGKDRGAVFLGQLWDHFGSEIVSNGELAATLTKTGDSIGIVVEDVDALADALYNLTGLGFSPEFLESWMSSLGMYSSEINVSADALLKMAQGFSAVSDSGVINLQGMLAGLREQFGDNTNAIWDYVDALIAASERGDLQLDLGADTVQEARDKIRDALNDVQTEEENVENADPAIEPEANIEPAMTELDRLDARLDRMTRTPRVIQVTVGSPTAAVGGIRGAFASGTAGAPGGLSIVNEKGPEIIAEGNQLRIAGGGQPTLTWLQPGAAVLTAGETRSALGGLDPAFFYGGIRAYALGSRGITDTGTGAAGLSKLNANQRQVVDAIKRAAASTSKAASAKIASASQARQYTAPMKATNSSSYGSSSGGSSGGSGGGGYSSGGGGGGSSSSSKSDSTLDGLKNIVSLRKSELSLLQAKDASVKDQINKEREIQDALKNQINYMVSIGGNQEEINKLWAEWYKINDDIAKLMKDMFKDVSDAAGREIDKLEDARDKELEVLDAQLEAMQAERDAKSDQLDYEEKLLAVEEARANLEKAMNGERTVRMWNAATGQWEHTYDAKTVASAQQAYDDALKALADYEDQMAYDMEVAAIEAQKEAIKESYKAQTDGWQEIIDSLEEPAESMEAVLKRIAESAMPDMEATITNLNTLLAKFGYHIGAGGTTYDSGGILGGLGGIKGTARPEMVLPPDITSKMLTPMSGSMFAQRMSELAYLYGGATPNGFAGMNNTSIGSVHNGSVFNLGGISMTAEQAKHTTVYDLARISRNLRAYNSTI